MIISGEYVALMAQMKSMYKKNNKEEPCTEE